MPTWAIVDDQVVIGSNTALCKMGLKQTAAQGQGGKSLRDTDGFKQVSASLPENVLSLTYADSEVMFNQMLMQVQQFWPMATMGAMQAGIRLPVMLPQLGHIAKDMQPSIEYNYADAAGFHSHYQGSGLEMSLRGVAGAALGAGVAMPALARARQQAFRVTSGANLSVIGTACRIYADDHDDKYPPSLEVLVEQGDLASKHLESKRRPAGFEGPSFIYIPGQTLAMNPGNFVAYENPAYCAEGINVLHLDGHVEFMKPERFLEELKGTYERLGREMPEIKFGN
jgi:prepilin-type processing-associated H-X9-DG protein